MRSVCRFPARNTTALPEKKPEILPAIPGQHSAASARTASGGRHTAMPCRNINQGVQHSPTAKVTPKQHFKLFDHAVFPPFCKTNLSSRLVPVCVYYSMLPAKVNKAIMHKSKPNSPVQNWCICIEPCVKPMGI